LSGKRMSIAEFVKKNPPKKHGNPCWACSIPERKEVDEAIRSGVGKRSITGWLQQECGYPKDMATEGRIAHHGRNHL